ncbi:MAG TPA: hypothetical protein VID04_05290 [Methylomirabilota bacterium]
MRLSGNVRQLATVTLMCSALIAGGVAPALANNNHHRHHWWDYLYYQVESLTRGLGNLGSRLTGRLDYLSRRVDQLAAKVAGQANASLVETIAKLGSDLNARIDLVSSDLSKLGAKVEPMYARLDAMNTTLESQLGAFNGSLTTLTASVGTLDGNVKALGDSVATLSGRVEKLEQGGISGGGRIVVDSQGNKVGDFVGFDPFSLPLVAMSDNLGHTFTLQVLPNRLRGEVYFLGDTCSGDGYVFSMDSSPISLAGVWNNTVYVTEAQTAPQPVTPRKVALDACEDWNGFQISALQAKPQMVLGANEKYVVK